MCLFSSFLFPDHMCYDTWQLVVCLGTYSCCRQQILLQCEAAEAEAVVSDCILFLFRREIRPHHSNSCKWPIATDVIAWSVSVTFVSPAKTAEPIEMPTGGWTRVESRIRWGPDLPSGRGNFWELPGPPEVTACH